MVNVKKVMVGMSGGVDSSVAAYLLKEQGYDVTGVMMLKKTSVSYADTVTRSCFDGSDADNVKDAASVCKKIGIPFKTVDVSEEYNTEVMAYFKEEYLSGRTPNPCVKCNTVIKFGLLPRFASEICGEYDFFATGHYARILYNKDTARYNLCRGKSVEKDQSYFLYRLSQQQLGKILFPLGEYNKDQIREIARNAELSVFAKKDSQDFYSGKYSELFNIEVKKGNIVDTKGKILGKHNGYWNYTIGQRRGIGVAAAEPLYVIDINPARNEIIVGKEVLADSCILTDMAFSSVSDIENGVSGKVKYRSAQKELAEAEIIKNTGDEYRVLFKNKAKALTPGQSLVMYDDNGVVICGGIIK